MTLGKWFVLGCGIIAMACSQAATLLFEATFDEGTAADFAMGEASPYFTRDTIACLADGLHGKAVRIGGWQKLMTPGTTNFTDRAYTWQYRAPGNILSEQGAVSFWLSPQDWDGQTNTDNKMFFHASCENDVAALFVYKPLPDSNLHFFMKNAGTSVGMPIKSIKDWKKGEWHHIAFNWNKDTMDFFVDGVPAKTIQYPALECPFSCFCLGNVGFPNETGGSLMDDLKIYDSPLSLAEISALYQSNSGENVRPEIGVGRLAAPVLDGVIHENEYSFGGTGFLTLVTQKLQAPYAQYFISHDENRVYMAVRSQLPDGFVAVAQGRDTNLWEREGIEVHISVPGGKNIQFIISPADSFYDSKEKDAQWNSETFEVKSSIIGNIWSCEFSFAKAEFGISRTFGLNLARSYKSPTRNTCIAPVMAAVGYCDSERFFQINLLEENYPPVAIDRLAVEDEKLNIAFVSANARNDITGEVALKDGNREIWKKSLSLEGSPVDYIQPLGQKKANAVVKLFSGKGSTIFSNCYALASEEEKPVSLGYVYTDMDTDTVKFVMNSMAAPEHRGKLRIDFKDLQENLIDSRTYDLAVDALHFTLDFPADTFPIGFYNAYGTRISPEGEESNVFKEGWRKPDKHPIPDYFADDQIKRQKPWTALEVANQSVSCLGRVYDFDSAVLFNSVVSLDKELLGKSVRLEVNGKTAEKAERPAAFDNHGDYCRVVQEAEVEGLKIVTESRVDYDGMVKVRMTFAPQAESCHLDSMKLIIPLNNEWMEMVNGNSGPGRKNCLSGDLTEREWCQDVFRNYAFWAGNNEVGFSWICKNGKGWHCQDTPRSLVLAYQENERTATLNFVDSPLELKEARTIEFAVMATPARKLDPKVLRTRLCDWQMWSCNFSSYFDYPELPFLNDKKDDPNAFHYNSFGTSPHSPDWNYYHKLWHTGTMGAFQEDFPAENQAQRDRDQYLITCFDSPTFLDFKIREIQFVLEHKEFGAQNLYFDLLCWMGCGSSDHGCGWTDDFGRLWGSFDWEGRRIYLQKAREALLKKNPDGLISLHAHCQRTPMVLAYGDIHAGGEDFVAEVGTSGNYYGVVNSEVLRSHSVPYGFGLKCLFIPQFERSLLFVNPTKQFDFDDPVNIKAMRHLLVMLFTHDIDPWYGDHREAMLIWELEKQFGWDAETAFVPKWNTEGLFAVESGDDENTLDIAVFRRNGRFLLAYVNDSPDEKTYTVRLELEKLLNKDTLKSIRDFYLPGKTHALQDGMLTLKLAPREADILWFE